MWSLFMGCPPSSSLIAIGFCKLTHARKYPSITVKHQRGKKTHINLAWFGMNQVTFTDDRKQDFTLSVNSTCPFPSLYKPTIFVTSTIEFPQVSNS